MGIVSNSLKSLTLAVSAGALMASPARAEEEEAGPGNAFYLTMVTQIAASHARNTPEVKAGARQFAEGKMTAKDLDSLFDQKFRDVFVNEREVEAEAQSELETTTSRLIHTGPKDAAECEQLSSNFDALALRENLLRFYDRMVIDGQYPGPLLRQPAEVQKADGILKVHQIVWNATCRKFAHE